MDNPDAENGINNVDNEIDKDNTRDEGTPKRQRLAASPVPSTSYVLTGGKNRDDTDDSSDNSTPDSESNDQDDSTPKALLVPEIFENVLRFVETRDLLTCRLVNSRWCGIATNIVRKNCPIIRFKDHSEMFLPKSSNDGSNSTSKSRNMKIHKTSFLDTMKNSTNIPCGKFIIHVKKNLDEYQALIDTLGSGINSLEIRNIWKVTDEVERFSNWMYSMENLHTLKMNLSKITEGKNCFGNMVVFESLKAIEITNILGRCKVNPDVFEGLFSRSQNLQRLKLDLNDYGLEEERKVIAINNVEKILTSFKTHGQLSGLQEMTFTILTNTFVDLLLQMATNGLQLKCLKVLNSISFTSEGSESEKFRKFLEGQKDYLEKLVIGQGADMIVEFPKNMPALKSLHVCMRESQFHPSGPVFKTPVDFSKQFPSLIELKLYGYWRDQSMQELFGQIEELTPSPCTTLKSLRMSYGSYLKVEGWIPKISDIFPNIKNLDLRHPRNSTLHELWESWPGLTTLKIVAFHSEKRNLFGDRYEYTDKECLDVGFTGLERQFCTRSKLTNINWITESDNIIQRFKKYPSITDLKDLKNFELKLISVGEDGDGNPTGGVVTELLIYLALIKMPYLKNLNICEWLPITGNFCVTDRTLDLTVDGVENLKRILKDTRISVTARCGRDFKMPDFLMIPGFNEFLTDKDEDEVFTVYAANVLSGYSARIPGGGGGYTHFSRY